MNIHPKFSSTDMAGVAGLIAFLADQDACIARLAELQAESKKAYEAQSAAQEAVNAEKELAKTAERALAEATDKAARNAVDAARLEREAKALAERDAALTIRTDMLDKRDDAQRAEALSLEHAAQELDARAAAVAAAEQALAEARAEHAEKVKKLRELAG
jgi:hypothetical protein